MSDKREQNELQVVDFNGDTLISIQDENEKVWVSLNRLCENLGIAFQSQSTKLKCDSRFTTNDIVTRGSDLKNRTFVCLPLDQLNGWLFTINPNKVKADLRDKLIRYQQECVQVLNDYWTKGVAVNPISGLNLQRDERLDKVEIALAKLADAMAGMIPAQLNLDGLPTPTQRLRRLLHATTLPKNFNRGGLFDHYFAQQYKLATGCYPPLRARVWCEKYPEHVIPLNKQTDELLVKMYHKYLEGQNQIQLKLVSPK